MKKALQKAAPLAVVVALVAAGIVGSRYAMNRAVGPRDGNPYEYSVGKLDEVPDGLILYREMAGIEPQLTSLTAVSIDNDDNIYIAGGDAVVVTNRTGEERRRIDLTATPTCLDVAPNGRVVVGYRSKIISYDTAGKRLHAFSDIPHGAVISSVATGNGFVFAADARHRVILKFHAGGNLITTLDGRQGDEEGPHFLVPNPHFDVAVSGPYSMWVTNPGRHQIEQFDFAGNLRASWRRESMRLEDFCGCCNPTDIAVLSDGTLVTSEKGIVRVKVYTADGDFQGVVAGPDAFDPETVGLVLAVDSADRIYVLDPKQKAVRIFEYDGAQGSSSTPNTES